jgi:hydroxymethylpyrimidine kinase/phosphomethylpyrimidine kinase
MRFGASSVRPSFETDFAARRAPNAGTMHEAMSDSERPSVRWQAARRRPVVWAIGGLDPSGGAGILMDARAIAAAGAHPAAVATVLTVQSTAGCADAMPVDASLVKAQLERLLAAQPPSAIKVGALGSGALASLVASFIAECTCPVVVDPVALASVAVEGGGGRPLASDEARATLLADVIPRGVIVCANGPELEALTGLPARDANTATLAARALIARGARAVYAKAGHWATSDASDVLVFDDATHLLAAPRLDAADVHGTGCTLASLLAGRLALVSEPTKAAIVEASRWAKSFLFRALESPIVVGEGQRVLRIERE